MFQVTKTYGHNLGLSTTFRQWRASSHCRFLHGYSLEIKLVFQAESLNSNNWVIDFGSLKPVKKWLEENFDHKTLIAVDDPALSLFETMEGSNLLDIVLVPATGCEGFAKWIHENIVAILRASTPQGGRGNDPVLVSVEVREHGANSAIYERPAHV